jgi:ATP-binding cassette, subfamily F, member 3
LTNKTYEFTGDGIKEFLGTVDEFLEKKKVDGFRQFEQEKKPELVTSNKSQVSSPAPKIEPKVDNKLKEIEKKIEKLEAEIKQWESKMTTEDFLNKAATDNTAYDQYNKLKSQLEAMMVEWEAMV